MLGLLEESMPKAGKVPVLNIKDIFSSTKTFEMTISRFFNKRKARLTKILLPCLATMQNQAFNRNIDRDMSLCGLRHTYCFQYFDKKDRKIFW